MEKKTILGVMLVMVLVFGMTVVGCDLYKPYVVEITNGTNFNVTLVVLERDGRVFTSDISGILPGSSKTYEFDTKDRSWPSRARLTVRVGIEDVEVTNTAGTSGAGVTTKYVLSGTSKETLKLSAGN